MCEPAVFTRIVCLAAVGRQPRAAPPPEGSVVPGARGAAARKAIQAGLIAGTLPAYHTRWVEPRGNCTAQSCMCCLHAPSSVICACRSCGEHYGPCGCGFVRGIDSPDFMTSCLAASLRAALRCNRWLDLEQRGLHGNSPTMLCIARASLPSSSTWCNNMLITSQFFYMLIPKFSFVILKYRNI